MNENQIKADAINNFVSTMIGAFDAGYVDKNNPTLSEIHQVARNHVKDNYGIELPNIIEQFGESTAKQCGLQIPNEKQNDKNYSLLYKEAREYVIESNRVSICGLQRKFKLGYNLAARLVEKMENNGLVSAPNHEGKRQVLDV